MLLKRYQPVRSLFLTGKCLLPVNSSYSVKSHEIVIVMKLLAAVNSRLKQFRKNSKYIRLLF